MRIVIESVENGFVVVLEQATKEGVLRKVFILSKGTDVLDFLKKLLDPSPIEVPSQNVVVPA